MSQMCSRCYKIVHRACQSFTESQDCDNRAIFDHLMSDRQTEIEVAGVIENGVVREFTPRRHTPNTLIHHLAEGNRAERRAAKSTKSKPKVTIKQIGGDDGYQWCVLVNGKVKWNGMTRQEAMWRKKEEEKTK